MEMNENTRLKDIMKEYPWLLDEAVEMDERLKVLKSPMAKMLLSRADLKEAAKRSGHSAEEIIAKIRELVKEHESA